jgi:electron transfer flavoprotein beta subunit
MQIYVCIKQVPDTETKIRTTATGIDPAGVKWVMNPYDEFAVEEALKLKAANAGAVVTAISLGPKARVVESLRTALAMGADEAVVINAPETTDNFATAKALAGYLKGQTYDIIFTGKSAIDDNSMAVTQMMAELLGIPHATVVSKFEAKDKVVTIEREIEGGASEIVEVKLPAVFGANKGLNTPRYASLPGIMKAKKKEIKEVELASLGVGETDIKIKLSDFELPKERPSCKLLTGDAQEQASQLARLLREEAKVI